MTVLPVSGVCHYTGARKPIKIINSKPIKYCPQYNAGIVCWSQKSIKPVWNPDEQAKISMLNVSDIKGTRLKDLIVEKHINLISYDKEPPNYVFTDKQGNQRLKPYLFILAVHVKPEYARQGACSEAEQKIIELSKQMGFEGRVKLFSKKSITKNSLIPSPSLAHWKNGFRFIDTASNTKMERVLTGELPLTSAPSGEMYYPV